MGTISIKVIPDGRENKYIVPLRNFTKSGISELKKDLQKHNYLAVADGDDIEDMEKAEKLINELEKLGAQVEVYDSDKFGEGKFDYQAISKKELNNYIKRLKEITEEIKDFDDELANN